MPNAVINDVAVIIPARLESTRLPNKMLLSESGKPLLYHAYESARRSELPVYVATDSQEIKRAMEEYGVSVIMTSKHPCGTDRVAEASISVTERRIVNVQGDMPDVNPSMIRLVASKIGDDHISTLASAIPWADAQTTSTVKVVRNNCGFAMYFSRQAIPCGAYKCHRHIGIYGYTKAMLMEISRLPMSDLETMERLEQLRWLDNNYRIVVGLASEHPMSIDSRSDYDRFLATIGKG